MLAIDLSSYLSFRACEHGGAREQALGTICCMLFVAYQLLGVAAHSFSSFLNRYLSVFSLFLFSSS